MIYKNNLLNRPRRMCSMITSYTPRNISIDAMRKELHNQFLNDLIPISVIGNVSKSINALLLNWENNSQTPVQHAFLLQQGLTEVNHPDYILINYPDLEYPFYPSSNWCTEIGPIEQSILADTWAWLVDQLLIQLYTMETEYQTLILNIIKLYSYPIKASLHTIFLWDLTNSLWIYQRYIVQ